MAIVDVVKWNASDELFAWKFPSEELSTWTQLIVAESQEAIFVKEGVMLGPFRAGHHVLDTKNFPILSKFVNIAFGEKSPFTAEVWFVNQAIPLDIKWGTSDPIQLQDPKYDVMVPVRAFGQFGVQIINSKKFLSKLVGTMPVFDRDKLVSYFRGLILTRVKNIIADTIVREGISVLEITTRLSSLSNTLQEIMKPELELYGLELKTFFINSINVPENDPAVAKVKAALAKRAEMNIIGYDYRQERTFNALEAASANPGGGAAAMNAGIGVAMGVGVGQALGNALNANLSETVGNVSDNPTAPQGTATTMQPCLKCGQPITQEMKYCQNCGMPTVQTYRPCPACGTEGLGKFCAECGSPLITKCESCGSVLPDKVKFCPECGAMTIKPKKEEKNEER